MPIAAWPNTESGSEPELEWAERKQSKTSLEPVCRSLMLMRKKIEYL